jgi:hypothetical protein
MMCTNLKTYSSRVFYYYYKTGRYTDRCSAPSDRRDISHGYATKEGCRTERKSRNLEYAMGVRLTGFTT